MSALPGHPQLLRHMSDRPPLKHHPLNQQATTMKIQPSISVSHEGLLGRVETSDISTQPGGPPLHRAGSVTNVPAEYS